MKQWTRLVAVAALLMFAMVAMAKASHADGKSIFLANKCNSCHSISAQGVQVKKSDDDDGGTKPPDLSHVGKTQSAQWITGFLHKTETLKGKKHKKAWKGSDADLTTLANWLASLK
jgi:mono/diheme cytochrome c family protein